MDFENEILKQVYAFQEDIKKNYPKKTVREIAEKYRLAILRILKLQEDLENSELEDEL